MMMVMILVRNYDDVDDDNDDSSSCYGHYCHCYNCQHIVIQALGQEPGKNMQCSTPKCTEALTNSASLTQQS